MNINVKLYATLRKYAPSEIGLGEEFQISLSGHSISDLVKQLHIPSENGIIVMVNGIRVTKLDQQLKEKDLVVIFPPLGGG